MCGCSNAQSKQLQVSKAIGLEKNDYEKIIANIEHAETKEMLKNNTTEAVEKYFVRSW